MVLKTLLSTLDQNYLQAMENSYELFLIAILGSHLVCHQMRTVMDVIHQFTSKTCHHLQRNIK